SSSKTTAASSMLPPSPPSASSTIRASQPSSANRLQWSGRRPFSAGCARSVMKSCCSATKRETLSRSSLCWSVREKFNVEPVLVGILKHSHREDLLGDDAALNLVGAGVDRCRAHEELAGGEARHIIVGIGRQVVRLLAQVVIDRAAWP